MSQAWNPQAYAHNARYVSDYGSPVLELLDPRPGERILDLGCGDGVLTRQLAERGCEVVGVDSSPDMIEAARGLGLDARVMDGHALEFEAEFDAVFSNAALHWMKRPGEVLAVFARVFVEALPAPEREAFVVDVVERCRPALYDPAKGWWVDYVRLRFAAVKPGY